MRVSTVTLIAALAMANAKLRSDNTQRNLIRDREEKLRAERDPFVRFQERPMLFDIKPKEIGGLHTLAFEKLSDIYSEKGPENDFDLMVNVAEVMSNSLCPRQDSFCDAYVYQATLDEFDAPRKEMEYPEGFNEDIKELLDVSMMSVGSMNQNNFEEVMGELSVIMDDLENMENASKDEQDLAMATVSVALESSDLWYNVYTDPDHKLHNVMMDKAEKMNRRRRLDETDGAIIVVEIEGKYWDGIFQLIIGLIIADTVGAFNGGKETLALVPKNPSLLWPWHYPSILGSVLVFHSIPASAKFALGRNTTEVIPANIDLPGF